AAFRAVGNQPQVSGNLPSVGKPRQVAQLRQEHHRRQHPDAAQRRQLHHGLLVARRFGQPQQRLIQSTNLFLQESQLPQNAGQQLAQSDSQALVSAATLQPAFKQSSPALPRSLGTRQPRSLQRALHLRLHRRQLAGRIQPSPHHFAIVSGLRIGRPDRRQSIAGQHMPFEQFQQRQGVFLVGLDSLLLRGTSDLRRRQYVTLDAR